MIFLKNVNNIEEHKGKSKSPLALSLSTPPNHHYKLFPVYFSKRDINSKNIHVCYLTPYSPYLHE